MKYFTFEDEILVKAKSCSGDVSPQVFDFTSAGAPVPITVAAFSPSRQSRGSTTISQRGFPHVAQATVSIRDFPRVLFTGLLRPPAMPEDDGGRPSPPDIGEASNMPVCLANLHISCVPGN